MTFARDSSRLGAVGVPTVASAQALRDLTWYSNDPPEAVHVLSEDGGLFKYVSGAAPGTYTNNGGNYAGTEIVPTGGNGSAGWVRHVDNTYQAAWTGCSVNATPEVNTAGIIAIANIVNEDNGGEIIFTGGQYLFSPNTHIDIIPDNPIVFTGSKRRVTIFSSVDPDPTDWILILGDITSASTHYFGVLDITLAPEKTITLTECRGITVAPTNRGEFKMDARYITGTAFWFYRPWNAIIDCITYKCGSETSRSLMITACLADQQVSNDIILSGTTEQDVNGWYIENLAVLRNQSSIKVHGGADTINPLHLHNISSGTIRVIQTLTFSGSAHILVTDESPTYTSYVPSLSAERTRLQLETQTLSNLKADSSGYAIGVSFVNSGSEIFIKGYIGTALDSTTRGIELINPGNAGATIDLSNLYFLDTSDPDYRIVDNRVGASRLLAYKGVGQHFPLRSTFITGNSDATLPGEVGAATLSGGITKTSQTTLMLSDQGTFTRGVALFQPVIPISASVIGSISTKIPIITGQRLHLPNSDTQFSTARLVRVTVGEKGVTAIHDPSNYWTIQIYRVTTLVSTLILNWESYSSVVGDGLPTFRGGSGIDGNWHSWDFTQGIVSDLSFSRDQPITAAITPVGSPVELQGITITLYSEIRI